MGKGKVLGAGNGSKRDNVSTKVLDQKNSHGASTLAIRNDDLKEREKVRWAPVSIRMGPG